MEYIIDYPALLVKSNPKGIDSLYRKCRTMTQEMVWTNCSRVMPPDDETKVICKFLSPKTASIRKCMGRNIWDFIEIRRTNPKKKKKD